MKPDHPPNRRHCQRLENLPADEGYRRINPNETYHAPTVRSRTSVGRIVLVLLGVMMTCASVAKAEWGRTADDYIRLPLWSPPNYNSTLCSDLNGGCWVAGAPVGLCHVDRLGNVTWGDSALWLREWPFRAKLVPVDTSSVIVAMLRVIRDTTKVYLNRINTDQELLWGEDGIAMENNHSPQGVMDAIPGPMPNTFLIHWASPGRRLRLINPDGETLWNANALRLPAWSENAKILTTSDNCIVLAHSVEPYPRDNPLVEVIKLNAEGEEIWRRRYAITNEPEPAFRGWVLSDVESDRDGGVILSTMFKRWNFVRDSLKYFSLGVMRVSGEGDSLWMHKVYERQVEWVEPERPGPVIDPFEQCEFILNYAGIGHFFASWLDGQQYSEDVFKTICLDNTGEFHWEQPIDVIETLFKFGGIVTVDSDSSVCFLWRDVDSTRGQRNQEWGQRIDFNGQRLWSRRGRVIQNRTASRHSATTDCNGGLISIVEYPSPFVQMMNRNGEIGVVLDPVGVINDSGFLRNNGITPKLNVYPNPSNSYLNVELIPVFPNEAFVYRFYDLQGRSVKTGTIKGFPYLVTDLSAFSSGVYILRLESPQMTADKRFSLVK